MRDAILDILTKSNSALTIMEISNQLNLKTPEQVKELIEEVNKLVDDFTIYRSNKDKYMLFENSHLKKGRLSVTTKGYGFVIIDGEKDDIYVDEKNMRGALNNDIVVVEPFKGRDGKIEGRITRVLKKENNLIVGEYTVLDNHPHFIPDDKKLKMEILLDERDCENLVPGHKIQVSIVKDLGKYKYKGEVVRVIGHKNDPGVDILSIVYKYGINDKFSDEFIK